MVVFTHLRAFDAVARHGGFTAGANALHVSQPTITSQVRDLEERHGVELFLRQGRKIILTETGRELFEISTRILKLHEDADELLSSSGRLVTGDLRIAAVGPFHATEMIARFLSSYPDFKVSVLLGNSDLTLSRILELEADVAVLAHHVDDPRVHSIPFSTHRVVAFVCADHPWFERDSIAIAELAVHPLILREQGSTTRRALESAAAAAGLALTPFLEIGSREGVWKAVERGLGVGVVADFEFVAHPRLRTLTIADADIRTEYRLAYLEERRSSRKINAFTGAVL